VCVRWSSLSVLTPRGAALRVGPEHCGAHTHTRRTADGWALLSTKRDGAADVPARDEKVGQPKGLSEYGWGETGYALSSASRPLKGKHWVSVPSCPPPPPPRASPLPCVRGAASQRL